MERHPKKIKLIFGGLFLFLTGQVFSAASSNIIVDQFGYKTNDPKIVIFAQPNTGIGSPSSFTPGATFYVINASGGATVFTGSPVAWNGGAVHSQSGDKAWQGTFSTLTTPGTYYVQVPGGSNPGAASYNFKISDAVYNGVVTTSQRMFFYQRCGGNISAANGGVNWNHTACHEGAGQDLSAHLWDAGADQGAGTARDVHGGWHDAGDYGKYVTFAHATLWYLLHSVEWYEQVYPDNTNIPESGNGVPDMLDEVKWELDWMLRMQRSSDGAIYSMVGFNNASGSNNQGNPANDTAPRFYLNVSTTATATGAMAFALGARIFQAYPTYASYAVTLQNAAVTAWGYLQLHAAPVTFDPTGLSSANANQGSGWDGEARLAAASELFALTGGAVYRTYFDNNYNSASVTDGGGFLPVHGLTSAGTDAFDPTLAEPLELAMVSYCLAPGATAAVTSAIGSALKNECEWNILPNNPGSDPYMSYMYDGHYTWGSNQIKASWGNQLLFAAKLGVNPAHTAAYLNQAEEYLHYFHGRNPLNWVYLTNMGTQGANLGASKSIMSIFHSWFWQGTTFDGNTGAGAIGPAPGILAGGPNQNFAPDTSYVGTISPPQNEPPMKSYKDWGNTWPEDSWEVTEPDQGYQGKYQFLLSAFAVSSAPTATPTVTPTGTLATATFTPTASPTSTATATPTPTPTTCVQLLNGAETINENGNWTGTNATRSISTTDATQLTHSLQAAVTNNPVGGWNDQILNLDGFAPTNFSNVVQVVLDINVPAGMVGATYSQLFLSADSSAPATYEKPLASNSVNLSAGENYNVTFNISLTGAFTPASPITKLYFIYNSDAATGPGTYGSFYVDNIRLVTNCAATVTPTRTPTPTLTKTPTLTPSASPTKSPTGTATNSPTDSVTSTDTSTSTNSPTATPTLSPTKTLSASPIPSPTPTASLTVTKTATNSSTATPTFTLTPTLPPTITSTPTLTLTGTVLPSNTPTLTSTLTPSPTTSPTQVTVSVSTGPAPPSDSTQLPGAPSISVMQFRLSNLGNSDSVSITSISLTALGTGDSAVGITSVSIYADNNADGLLDAGDVLLGTGVYPSANGTVVIGINGFLPAVTGTQTYLVVYHFSGSAPAGTYGVSIPGPSGIDLTTGQPVGIYWNTVNRAIITIAAATFTPTLTPTNIVPANTATPTKTSSPTPTFSATSTATFTKTNTPIVTPTATGSGSGTAMSTPGFKPVFYPNPTDGSSPVWLRLNLTVSTDVKVQLFTVAYRKVFEQSFSNVAVGKDIPVELKDKWGTPLASGIYYVVVTTSGGRSIGKLLILR